MTLPSAEHEPNRYKGRPLLIILENYILAVIGSLSDETRQSMAVVVQRAFGQGSDWMAIVRERLKLEDSMDEQLRELWLANQRVAQANGTQLHPVQFAKMVTDENFAPLIGAPLE